MPYVNKRYACHVTREPLTPELYNGIYQLWMNANNFKVIDGPQTQGQLLENMKKKRTKHVNQRRLRNN